MLGRGVTTFMKSILGFEQDIMKEAAQKLAEAEATAWADLKKAQKEANSARTSIYPPGSQYALCHAQAQLMSAVVGILNINLVEVMKSFYKLRKAFVTLDGLIAAERRALNGEISHASESLLSSSSRQSRKPVVSGGFGGEDESGASSENEISEKALDQVTKQLAPMTNKTAGDDDSNLDFPDASEKLSGAQRPTTYLGQMDIIDVGKKSDQVPLNYDDTALELLVGDELPDSAIFTDPTDVFVHSGSYLCYGVLLLIISLVPPIFNRVLQIVGFKGDRERGVRMLWQSTKFEHVNGAVAGLVLLGYYNNLVGTCDILPASTNDGEDILGYPVKRCRALLDEMRIRYPASRLWRLEDGRMQAGARDLEGAITTLELNADSKVKQVTAMAMFEKALCQMYSHRYSECAASFMYCKDMNNWSHCLYYLIAGGCYVSLYREARATDAVAAQKFKFKATEYIRKAPTVAGRKRFLAKPGPFDVFVMRKVQKWEERSKEWQVDLIDAIGVDPIEELIYLWNGARKMQPTGLEKSLQALAWSQTSYPDRHQNDLDEITLHGLLTATVQRTMGNLSSARQILTTDVLSHDRAAFVGLMDDWTCPSAHYEAAVLCWREKDINVEEHDAKILECEAFLEKCAKWDAYTMDARIGVKVSTALDTIKRYKARNV